MSFNFVISKIWTKRRRSLFKKRKTTEFEEKNSKIFPIFLKIKEATKFVQKTNTARE
jgi:hypothetical protein